MEQAKLFTKVSNDFITLLDVGLYTVQAHEQGYIDGGFSVLHVRFENYVASLLKN